MGLVFKLASEASHSQGSQAKCGCGAQSVAVKPVAGFGLVVWWGLKSFRLFVPQGMS